MLFFPEIQIVVLHKLHNSTKAKDWKCCRALNMALMPSYYTWWTDRNGPLNITALVHVTRASENTLVHTSYMFFKNMVKL